MTWIWTDSGEHRFVGGTSGVGTHYAKDYANAGHFPGWPKPRLKDLPAIARKAVRYPPLRSIDGVRLTAREFAFVNLLSCRSRAVFWLYFKLRWPARQVAEAFNYSIVDQHSVYERNKAIKRAMFTAQNEGKNVDWGELLALYHDGASEEELADFYGLNIDTIRKRTRG